VTPCLAAVVYVAVNHDPQQPSLEVCSRLKRSEGRTRCQHGFLHKILRLIVVAGEANSVAAQALPQRRDLTHEPCSQIGVRGTPLDRCSFTGGHRLIARRGHRHPPVANAALPGRQLDYVCPCRSSVLVVYHMVRHVDGKDDVAADTVSQRSVSPPTPAIHRVISRPWATRAAGWHQTPSSDCWRRRHLGRAFTPASSDLLG
jgi:hypothetical protein